MEGEETWGSGLLRDSYFVRPWVFPQLSPQEWQGKAS